MRLPQPRWNRGGRDRAGQGLVEFALALPVFLLLIYGIVQSVLVYKAYVAINQAATDAAHELAAQSSDGPLNGGLFTQADARGLAAISSALKIQNMNQVLSIDVASVDSTGNPKQVGVVASSDFQGTGIFTPTAQLVTLDNNYTPAPPTTGQTNCQVGRFWLTNALSPTTGTPSFQACSPPWDSSSWGNKVNDNGRHDTRCNEDTVKVTITYLYASFSFPVRWNITLTGQDTTILEPRQFMGDAGTQQAIATCS